MIAVLILMVIFGGVLGIVLGPRALSLAHERKLKELEMARAGVPLLEGAKVERKLLEERIRNLETIVCGVDLELNAKLNRLASRQLMITALPAHDSTLAPTLRAQTGETMKPGARLGDRYVIERVLGTGGMGAVYLARDEKLGEPVALKLVRDVQHADASVLDRFRREVSAARRISHPHVVRLHDLGEHEGQLYISMEYVAGDSLREVLRRNGVLPADRVRAIASQICEGLAAAHTAGVIHRDLKPENVLLTQTQSVKIIDFGIAKLADLEGMTATRIILGTPQYMSPEHIRGKTADARSDLYALGCVVYEALTGAPPFDGTSAIAVSFAHCNDRVTPLRERRADVPEPWEPFIQRALAKEPADRFDSADAMRKALPT